MKQTYLTEHGSTTWSPAPQWGVVADSYYYYSEPIYYERGHCQTGYYHHFFDTEQELNDFIAQRTFNSHIPPYREDSGKLSWIENEWVEAAFLRVHNNIRYKALQAHRTQFTPDITPALWEVVPMSDDWIPGAFYKRFARVLYNALWYIVQQQHTSQAHWTPDTVPALYLPAPLPSIPTDTPEFSEAQKPYTLNALVQIAGEAYENYVEENHWHPLVYGWRHVGQVSANPCEGIAAWDPAQHWSTYTNGDKRKDGGKVWQLHNKSWAQSYAPSSAWGHYGWTFLYDCPQP